MSSSVRTEEILSEQVNTTLGEDADTIIKAYFIGEAKEGSSESKVLNEPDNKQQALFQTSGAIAPLYDPVGLAIVYENSSCLRSNVDSYITNVDSFGHQFPPTIDLDQPGADVQIRNAIVMERRDAKAAALLAGSDRTETQKAAIERSETPSEKEIAERKEELRIAISEEKAMIELFFENCTVDIPFSGPEGLRGLTRMNLEVIGNGYWEILRDGLKRIAQFNHVPAESMRLLPVDEKFTEVDIQVRVSPLSWKTVRVLKRFRLFVQSWEGNTKAVYFKEFGDPRTVSSKTGGKFKDLEELKRVEGPEATEATEIFWFKITSMRSPYGAPRWIGTLLAVLGNRQSEEGNFIYFENRSVPPMAVLVSGGRLHKDSVAKLESHIRDNIKGARNNHKILILEAESANSPGTVAGGGGGAGTPARMKIEIVPLSDSQLKDALFQQYDERNFDKVGQAFRLPRLLRGDVRDFNRSTASASVDFAEVQVFGPIRQQFDWVINKTIMPAIGARYHVFRSNAPTVRDPEALAGMIERMVKASVLTPGEGRALCSAVFNKEFAVIDAAWTRQPFAMTVSGWSVQDDLNTPDNESEKYPLRPTLPGETNAAAGATSADIADDVGKRSVAPDDDEEDDDEEDDTNTPSSKKQQTLLASRAIGRLHKHVQNAERAALQATLRKMERVVVKLSEAEMRALVEPTK